MGNNPDADYETASLDDTYKLLQPLFEQGWTIASASGLLNETIAATLHGPNGERKTAILSVSKDGVKRAESVASQLINEHTDSPEAQSWIIMGSTI